MKSLFRRYLEHIGFATTRSADLDEATKELHYAFCMLDSEQLELAQKQLLCLSVRDLINSFGAVEELRKDFVND